ncbi:hypothetical protein BOX15_Mlig022956g1 [Macrostomum lignano]|uniref:Uncharacterized protein n=2 Tax=Macrostomum lignano TaxID=282301 RepID=A0A267GFB1_9PLAT|nr:hypothetical protein BOX15_Mlig022956g1 [Macrostomum lignano]
MSEAQSQKGSSKPQTPATGAGDKQQDLVPRESDFTDNKAYLLTASSQSGMNLYDHLIVCLKKILEEKPSNVVDIFEDISKEGKRARFASNVDTVQNQYERTTEVAKAEVQRHLFEPTQGDEDEEEMDSALPNLWQTAYLFEQGGVGLDAEETYRLWLALKELEKQHSFEQLRFWGKILGTEGGYYIAEGLLKQDEIDAIVEEEAKAAAATASSADGSKPEQAGADSAADAEAAGDADEEPPEDPIPKPDFKPPPVVPREDAGSGVNRFVYFVCSEPGRPWTRLPSVTPAQIQAARKVKKFFTGRLDAPVVTYPPFPGNEANYLRAQVCRISAGTIISPQGFYMFDEEEEEDEEGGGRDNFVENPEFEPMPVRELIDPSLSSWVHHVQHVLPQGRTRWWNPAQKRDDDSVDDEDEEEKEEMDEPQPEEGPPLLTPLSEDAEVDGNQPWTARLSSQLLPQFSVAVLSSNLWPGAHAVAQGSLFENVYIGWGHKYATENYSPPPPPPVLLEFPSGPEITETEDPTPEEEAALKAALAEAEEGAEEDAGEEEEDEEEDD